MPETQTPQLYNPHETDTCSDPFYKFISEYDRLMGYFFFLVNVISHVDQAREKAVRVLAQIDSKPVDEDALKNKTAFKVLQKYKVINSRLLTVNMVDNFLCYLSEIIQSVMKKRAEVLRSREQVSLEEVFQFRKFDELASYIVDRKMNELSYGGLSKNKNLSVIGLG